MDITVDLEMTTTVKGTNVFLCPSSVTNATEGPYVGRATAKAYEDLESGEGKQLDALISTRE